MSTKITITATRTCERCSETEQVDIPEKDYPMIVPSLHGWGVFGMRIGRVGEPHGGDLCPACVRFAVDWLGAGCVADKPHGPPARARSEPYL
jgi:hypothetical protein